MTTPPDGGLEGDRSSAPGPEDEDPPAARAVMRGYLLISAIYTFSASLIWGVNTLFLLDAGLDILGVFVANAVFTATMSVFEIPTGVVADTHGRRLSFLLSVAILCVGTLAYVAGSFLGGGLLYFCLASVVLGIGFTFYSGAVEAWLVDALRATGSLMSMDRVFARGSFVSGAAMLLGTVGGGVLAMAGLWAPYVLRSVALVAAFVVAFVTMHDLGFTPESRQRGQLFSDMRRLARDSISFGWRIRPTRLLIILAFIRAVVAAWAFYAWQPYFLQLLGKDAPWIAGVIAALVSLATMGGNSIVEWSTRYCGKRTTLLGFSMGLQCVAILGVGLASSFWLAVTLYLVSSVGSGVFNPVRRAYLHQLIPSNQRATIVSFDSLVDSAGSMVGQGGLGYLARAHSIAIGYVVGGAFLGLALPVVGALRRIGQSHDWIVGRAGQQGACAAQGLPSVTGVDQRSS